jgi:hypothetical protein
VEDEAGAEEDVEELDLEDSELDAGLDAKQRGKDARKDCTHQQRTPRREEMQVRLCQGRRERGL